MEPFDGAPRTPRLPRQVGQTLTELAHVTNELVRATTVEAVTTVVTEHMADAVGATIAALGLRHGEHEARLIGVRGLPPEEASSYRTFPLDTGNSMAEAEEWAASIPNPAYAMDDQTAITVVDDAVEVVSEGTWARLP